MEHPPSEVGKSSWQALTDVELEKVEAIRRRLPVGYREARAALEACGGDLLEALARLEEEIRNDETQAGLWGRVKTELRRLWREGSDTRLRIARGQRLLVDVPVLVGLLSAVAAPSLTLVAALGAVATDCRLTLEKESKHFRAGKERAVVDGFSRV
ncbi:MAG: DUF4342 domain-containing protein [Limnochordales bacterium]|nr:DUF4342 domain-containing protein [Limnochordales bacterium]